MSVSQSQQEIFNNLSQIKALEAQIASAGITAIKPLAAKLAKLTRVTMGRLAQEVFSRG